MSAAPLDNIFIQIETHLGRLRTEMGQAEAIVDLTTKRMDAKTKTQGPFAFLMGSTGSIIGRGLIGIQGARALLGALEEATDRSRSATDNARAALERLGSVLTFGVSDSIIKVIQNLTGYTEALKKAKIEEDRMLAAANAAWEVQQKTIGGAFDLAMAEADYPEQRAAAQLAKRRFEIRREAQELRNQGVPGPEVRRLTELEEKIAEREAVRSVYGPAPASEIPRLLQEIVKNTSPTATGSAR